MATLKYFKNAVFVPPSEDGFISICTFWTPKDDVIKLITEENMKKVYAIGNLYTYLGLEWIMRNMFLNPKFQHIIFTGVDNNHLIPHLKAKEGGFSDYPEYEERWWSYFGKSENCTFLENYKDINNVLEKIQRKQDWISEPIEIPPPKKREVSDFDSEKSGFVVRDDNLFRLWKRGLRVIKLFGTTNKGTREVVSLTCVLTKPPVVNDKMPAHEIMEQYLPQVCDSKPTPGLVYTYGSRLHDHKQIDNVIHNLTENIFSRQALSITWEKESDPYHNNPPCLVLCHFLIQPLPKSKIRDSNDFKTYMKIIRGELTDGDDYEKYKNEINSSEPTHIIYLSNIFRSWDFGKASCLNQYGLWAFRDKIRKILIENTKLNIINGNMTTTGISCHVYEQDFKFFELCKDYGEMMDMRGYFTITLLRDEQKLKITLMSKDDKPCKEFISDNVRDICEWCEPHIAEIQHALYVGREVQRAMQCLKEGTEFKQN